MDETSINRTPAVAGINGGWPRFRLHPHRKCGLKLEYEKIVMYHLPAVTFHGDLVLRKEENHGHL